MHKKFVYLTALLLCLLTGCTSADSGIILSDVSDVSADGADIASRDYSKEIPKTPEDNPDRVSEKSEDSFPEKEEPEVVVFVCGAVKNPGVYTFPKDTRIDEAIKEAGGFLENADRTYVNLAAKLTDGTKLVIPTLEEASDKEKVSGIESFDKEVVSAGDSGQYSKLVNINTASAEELKTLPGIGDGIAGRIVKYRDENGSFKTKEDIMKVSGIKEKLFSKISDHITV